MRKIYIAKRIASNTFADAFVEIEPNATATNLVHAYKNRSIVREKYIHNGHWILRPADASGVLVESKLPFGLAPQHIIEAVIGKLNDSDALVAIINNSAYGTIVEIGYAVGTSRLAVYVLPDESVTQNQLQDLWMSFHLAFLTASL